jgi:hypothetical protein
MTARLVVEVDADRVSGQPRPYPWVVIVRVVAMTGRGTACGQARQKGFVPITNRQYADAVTMPTHARRSSYGCGVRQR